MLLFYVNVTPHAFDQMADKAGKQSTVVIIINEWLMNEAQLMNCSAVTFEASCSYQTVK